MAESFEPTVEQRAGWDDWVAERPDNVRVVAERFNPWTLYRIKDTDQRVRTISFGEGRENNGKVTLTVEVLAEFNLLVPIGFQVFGLDPDDLDECDLPDGA